MLKAAAGRSALAARAAVGHARHVTPTPEPEEATTRRRLAALGPEECRARLAHAHIGRVVFVDGRGPVALPVNFGVLDDDIVFRTAASSSLLASSYVDRVGFEVDEIDERRREGWSVLVTGAVRLVTDETELDTVRQLGVAPWAEGERTRYLRLRVRTITGRHLVVAEDAPGSVGEQPHG
jgi:nitroimidazol reductase NimA-like FMN-containing flavoprotein (pyridoxamine 5'-phosphate oxidase superfamily)